MSIHPILEDLNPWWRDSGQRRAGRYPVRRDVQPRVLHHVGTEERRALLLLGPRQVGKTTVLLQCADDLLEKDFPPANLTYFDFSDDRVVGEVGARDVAEVVPPGGDADYPRVLLLDEISRAPRWDLWLKGAVDRGGVRIVATDSAASLLREGARDSGQGRWDEWVLEGLTLGEFVRMSLGIAESEAPERPDLVERYLALGGFPEHVGSEDPPSVRRRLRSDVVDRALMRDLAGRVDDPRRVRDLFVYLLQDSGAKLDRGNRADDLGADPRTVGSWVELLKETFLLVELRELVLSKKAAARLGRNAKLYAADPALVPAFAASPQPGCDPEVRAAVFEAAAYRHLRELARREGGELAYARLGDDLEVDFVLRRPDGELVAVEVTSSPKVKPRKLARLNEVADRIGAAARVLVHGGWIEEERQGVRVLPMGRFLLDPGRALRPLDGSGEGEAS